MAIGAAADYLLERLEHDSGRPASEVLLRALGLYRIALDACREGDRIAVVDRDGEVVQEITGIGPFPPDDGPPLSSGGDRPGEDSSPRDQPCSAAHPGPG